MVTVDGVLSTGRFERALDALPLEEELLCRREGALSAWLDGDELDWEESVDSVPSAWAIPEPLATAAPIPSVSAPTPSQP